MQELFSRYSLVLLTNTVEIAKRCNVTSYSWVGRTFQISPVPVGMTAEGSPYKGSTEKVYPTVYMLSLHIRRRCYLLI